MCEPLRTKAQITENEFGFFFPNDPITCIFVPSRVERVGKAAVKDFHPLLRLGAFANSEVNVVKRLFLIFRRENHLTLLKGLGSNKMQSSKTIQIHCM